MKALALKIVFPSYYVDDVDRIRECCGDEFNSESDFLLNLVGEPGPVRVRMEIMGEKDSDIIEVWG